ncbi:hypothetical protein BZA70DRAFT_293202 [Myxozyma melibiosi]|uniref:Ubiquitin-like 1-activating enzyme E1A n=1 Tax=Myxozyma melibiosi TaxID=54550 RepID=A0ABR1FDJ6_9ASCO
MTDDKKISADEIALYDRQIRLWGIAAQTRMREANVLLITAGALSNEIAKNIVLAGIGSLTVLDSATVTPPDLGAQFFLEESDVGKNRAEAAVPRIQKLNTRVIVTADTSDITTKDAEYFSKFDIVVATELAASELITINEACRKYSKCFYAGGMSGLYGYIFVDLIEHSFSFERDQSNSATKLGPETSTRSVVDVKLKKGDGKLLKEVVTKKEVYKPLAESLKSDSLSKLRARSQLKVSPVLPAFRALWDFQSTTSRLPSPEDFSTFEELVHNNTRDLGLPVGIITPQFVKSFLSGVGAEISPVAAIIGGAMAQDILNVLGQRQQPIQNWVVYDCDTSTAPIYTL